MPTKTSKSKKPITKKKSVAISSARLVSTEGTGSKGAFIPSDVKKGGLKISWIKFIDEYIRNGGNGTRAYMAVFPECSNAKVAGVQATWLLNNPSIINQIRCTLESETVTKEWISSNLVKAAQFHLYGKQAHVGIRALEVLAKMGGYLDDTVKLVFNKDNPAVFQSPYTEEEKLKMIEQANTSRIYE